ncbi:MAG TPA: hypothetical protein VMI10_10420 [Terriglobales bacterium]|nr:hypothetical protein [Terriglobales bacterium]HTT21693.1 hypothetical protein [Candidatus Sulfotelmatobacter sp.]
MRKRCSRHANADRYHWKAELQAIINANNWAHSVHAKNVAFKTMEDRAYFLHSMFRTLWNELSPTKLRVMPRNFALRHVEALVPYWVDQQLEPGTIRLYLSYVRTFCDWIRKRGMVHEPERYVDDPARVKRVYAAKEDRGWRSHGVAAQEKIAEMEAICPYAGCQAEMSVAYALRPKEAMMIRPHEAERNGRIAVTTVEDPKRYAELRAQLEVKRGTKGGRMRLVPIDTPEKRAVLEKAKRLVAKGAHLGVPGRSLAWNRRHFYTVCEKVGLTRKELGVTPYGARHQYAGDRYQQCAGEPPPVRGGRPIDREVDRAARLQVARELGHSRESITGAYLGGVLGAERASRHRRD